MSNFLRILIALLMIPVNLVYCTFGGYAMPAISRSDRYLFVHFVGNEPEQERISFAVSEDGYNFKALNGNEPVIKQEKGTGCVRDPYILKGQDGCWYIVATDMRCYDGWTSNHSLVTWKSTDLINWTDETIIDMRDIEGFENCNRCWAPEAVWDAEKGSYMIYWAISTEENDIAALYYAYTDDFKTITTPELLYGREGVQTIDGDIGYNEKTGYYYLYFKHEEDQTIAYVKSKNLSGPYEGEPVICSLTGNLVEGSTIYRINGTDTFVMIMDEFCAGTFAMQQTTDFENFKRVGRKNYSFEGISPRHGSMITISEDDYARLVDTFGIAD